MISIDSCFDAFPKPENVMEQMPQNTFEDNDNQRSLSRRELIKIIGAAGCAVTATALIPDRWLPPQIDIGVLPAHAQTSEALTVSSLRITPYVPQGFMGNMTYFDPLRQTALNTSQVLGYVCDDNTPCDLIQIQPALALSGHVLFNFTPPVFCLNTTFVAQLATDGRFSNELSMKLPDG
jgi:hypothetical protein